MARPSALDGGARRLVRDGAVPGSRWARPPVSLPPIALGWPVSEKGPAPDADLARGQVQVDDGRVLVRSHVALVMPMLHRVSAARERPKRRAAATMISGESPVMADARSGEYASTTFAHAVPARLVVGHEGVIEQPVLAEHVEHRVQQRDVRSRPERQVQIGESGRLRKRGSATITRCRRGRRASAS